MWRSKKQDVRVVRDYIAALNARDLDAVSRLVGADCTFIDSRGGSVRGHDHCIEASRRFFALDIDYELRVETIVAHPPDVLITGQMRSNETGLARDRLWRARAEGANLVEWQSFSEGRGLGVARLLMPRIASEV